MKLRFLVTIIALALALSPMGAPAAATETAPSYYLSLGDSLAAGTQPGRAFTNEGYADQLAAALRTKMPTLQLVKLGCPGEATTSMITPDLPFEGRTGHNACRYPRGSQLAAWASDQSTVIGSRAVLDERMRAAAERFAGIDVPPPTDWGGYRLRPEVVEFWQGRPDRLHDRLRYRSVDGSWQIERLAP